MSTLAPTRFGPEQRKVLGLIQQPSEGASTASAFLLARPIGLAATRSASMYRVLSDRLSRTGAAVMRFDYHGTGDSPGDESAQSLQDWTKDVQEAQTCLINATRAKHVDWFGMALGANLMLQAALRSPQPPRKLVLWEPIEDGPQHLENLIGAHRHELSMQLARPWPDLLSSGMAHEPRLPGSVLGFDIGAQLLNDIQNLPHIAPWLSLLMERGIDVTLCATEAALTRMTASLPSSRQNRIRLLPLGQQTNWLSSEAMGAAVVPPELGQILEALTP